MPEPRILLIEDDAGLIVTIGDRFEREGYRFEVARDGFLGLGCARSGHFDVVVLDLMLPGLDGYEVCARLRDRDVRTPVLMLTARDRVVDKVAGLRLGADDYLTKPFEPDELIARIEALLRRVAASSAPPRLDRLSLPGVRIDLQRRTVERDGKRHRLSVKEADLLRHLAACPGTPVARETLLERVWGYRRGASSRTVDVHVAGLRKKIEADPRHPVYLCTVHGVGYLFALHDAEETENRASGTDGST